MLQHEGMPLFCAIAGSIAAYDAESISYPLQHMARPLHLLGRQSQSLPIVHMRRRIVRCTKILIGVRHNVAGVGWGHTPRYGTYVHRNTQIRFLKLLTTVVFCLNYVHKELQKVLLIALMCCINVTLHIYFHIWIDTAVKSEYNYRNLGIKLKPQCLNPKVKTYIL